MSENMTRGNRSVRQTIKDKMKEGYHCLHMTYEKPVIIDLSRQSEKGYGGLCSDGSGQNASCTTGPTAGEFCEVGNIYGGYKYED